MASQAKGGFSTEGTQYATDSSYYLLDTVPGSGSVIEGPVTVTNNLTVTGSETVQGSLGVAGNITAPGLFAPPAAAAPLALVGSTTFTGGVKISVPFGATGQVSVEGGGANFLGLPANGNINLITSAVPGTVADRITISNAGVGTLTQLNGIDISGGLVTLNGGQGGSGKVDIINEGNQGLNLINSAGALSVLNYGTGVLQFINTTPNQALNIINQVGPISISGSSNPLNGISIGSPDSANGVWLRSGLSCDGSYAAPTTITTGAYGMSTNKAFFQTNQPINLISLPGALSSGSRGVVLVQGQSSRQFAPLTNTCDGNIISLTFTPGSGTHFFTVVAF